MPGCSKNFPGTKYKMPGKFLGKRKYVRRVRKGRPVRKFRMGRNKNHRLKGSLFLIRKLPLITLTSNTLSGTFTLNDPTATCVTLGTATASPGTVGLYDVPFSMKFSLSQLMSYTDITQIADQYKINSVYVRVNSTYQVSTGVGQGPAWIEYIQDHDDATPPTLSQLRTKMGVKTKYFGPTRSNISMGVRPRIADEVYRSGVLSAYAVGPKNQWINAEYPDVEQYGIKGILHNMYSNGAANQGMISFDIAVSVSAKDLQ